LPESAPIRQAARKGNHDSVANQLSGKVKFFQNDVTAKRIARAPKAADIN
jgi:hypothetical protein